MTETVTIAYLPIPASNWQPVRHGETRQVVFTKRAADSQITTAGAIYDSFSDVGEIRVYRRADFQSGSRVLKKVF